MRGKLLGFGLIDLLLVLAVLALVVVVVIVSGVLPPPPGPRPGDESGVDIADDDEGIDLDDFGRATIRLHAHWTEDDYVEGPGQGDDHYNVYGQGAILKVENSSLVIATVPSALGLRALALSEGGSENAEILEYGITCSLADTVLTAESVGFSVSDTNLAFIRIDVLPEAIGLVESSGLENYICSMPSLNDTVHTFTNGSISRPYAVVSTENHVSPSDTTDLLASYFLIDQDVVGSYSAGTPVLVASEGGYLWAGLLEQQGDAVTWSGEYYNPLVSWYTADASGAANCLVSIFGKPAHEVR